jgi:hypothetical protein
MVVAVVVKAVPTDLVAGVDVGLMMASSLANSARLATSVGLRT